MQPHNRENTFLLLYYYHLPPHFRYISKCEYNHVNDNSRQHCRTSVNLASCQAWAAFKPGSRNRAEDQWHDSVLSSCSYYCFCSCRCPRSWNFNVTCKWDLNIKYRKRVSFTHQFSQKQGQTLQYHWSGIENCIGDYPELTNMTFNPAKM